LEMGNVWQKSTFNFFLQTINNSFVETGFYISIT
jgi:hypothetical protein